jgi:hypothetical protein
MRRDFSTPELFATYPNLSELEVATINRHLKGAMIALDACGQDDLADQVKLIFKEVAHRCYDQGGENS